VTGSTQTTAKTSYAFSYGYSLSDQLTSIQYPSSRTITYGLDTADRITSVKGYYLSTPTTYASPIAYTAPGGFSSIALKKITETYSWNDRLQQTGITASNGTSKLLALNFYPCDGGNTACSNNNGNIWRETVSNPGLTFAAQEYRYDNLNRLVLATETPPGYEPSSATVSAVHGYQPSEHMVPAVRV
jgi:hypothetical protein